MVAFVAPTALSPSLRTNSLTNVSTHRHRTSHSARPVTRALMAERPDSSSNLSEQSSTASASTIDFSAINISEIGSNLAGLVFTPEDESSSFLQTRVNVGFTDAQQNVLNDHINVEYTAMYAYHALWAYFDRDAVALPGFAKFFKEQSDEERDHAHEFMQYQNKRGGVVQMKPIALPEMKFSMASGVADAQYAMELALQLEKFVYAKLMKVHKVADEVGDAQMCDFIEGYLEEQVDAIKMIAQYVSQIKRIGTAHGVYHIDLELRGEGPAPAAAA